MSFESYIGEIQQNLNAGNATEHTHRPALKTLVESLDSVTATNEPRREEAGAPDYIVTRSGVPLGYIEAKDVGKNLSSASEIRELAGVLGQSERGIFVSSGGFTKEALSEPATARIVLVDGKRLQALLVEYYDRLDQDSQSLVPLRRLYFPSE